MGCGTRMKRTWISCVALGGLVALIACGSDDQSQNGAGPGSDGGADDAGESLSSPSGTLNWVKTIGGTISDEGRDITAVSDGFIAVGFISAEAKVDTDDPNAIRVTSAGSKGPTDYTASPDAFIAKFRNDGTVAWAKRAGGNQNDIATGVAGLDDGSSVVVGMSGGDAKFGDGESKATTVSAGGQFVARYAPDGSLVWAKPTGHGGFAPRAARLSTDAAVVIGALGKSSLPPGEGVGISGNGFFVARYEADGHVVWAKGVNNASAASISAFAEGGFVVGGTLQGSATFGAGEANAQTLKGSAFVARYGVDGSLLWAKAFAGDGADVLGVAAVPGGRVGIAGQFTKAITIGNTALLPATTESQSTAFVGMLDEAGNALWAKRSKSKSYDGAIARQVAAFDDGSLAVVGEYNHEVILGEGEPGELDVVGTPTLNGRFNTFLARYGADGKLGWVRRGTDAERTWAVVATGTAIGWIGSFSQATAFDSKDPAQTKVTPLGGADVFVARYLR